MSLPCHRVNPAAQQLHEQVRRSGGIGSTTEQYLTSYIHKVQEAAMLRVQFCKANTGIERRLQGNLQLTDVVLSVW